MSCIPEYGDLEYRGSEELEHPLDYGVTARAAMAALEVAQNGMELEPSCESPIEIQFGAELKRRLSERFRLEPQYAFRRFRMDFAIIRADGRPCLFIECDGKAFHSTAAQKANDAAKDAAAASSHIPLLRFTGSRIFRDAAGCARTVAKMLEGLA